MWLWQARIPIRWDSMDAYLCAVLCHPCAVYRVLCALLRRNLNRMNMGCLRAFFLPFFSLLHYLPLEGYAVYY